MAEDKKKRRPYGKGTSSKAKYKKYASEEKEQVKTVAENGKLGSIERDNDIGWWTKYPETAALAANFPFASITGADISADMDISLPGIMVLNTYMLPGVNEDGMSGANKAFKEITRDMIQALGGTGAGDSADVGQYILMLDSAYAYVANTIRLYGSIGSFNPVNKFTPEMLINAQGYTYSDVLNNAPLLRVYINKWIDELNALPMPKGISLIDRHNQIFGNYFTDVSSLRGQIYMYKPQGFYVYDEANGKLHFATTPTLTVQDLINFGEYMIGRIRNSQNMTTLGGRILRAYGNEIYHFEHMPADYAASIVYSPEMLMEIHNTVMVGDPTSQANGLLSYTTYPSLAIAQSTQNGDSYIVNQPTIPTGNLNVTAAYVANKNFVDVPTSSDTQVPAAVAIIATRGLVTCAKDSNTNIKLTSAGTEFIGSYKLVYRDTNGALSTITPNVGRWWRGLSTATLDPTTFELYNVWSKFDWAPYIGEIVDSTVVGLFGDINMFAPVSEAALKVLNDICVMSALDCVKPMTRKF